MVDACPALLQRGGMVDVAGNGNPRLLREMAEHGAENRQWRVAARPRARLQHDGLAGLVGCFREGQRIFPAQHHEPRHGMVAGGGGIEKLAQRGDGHLNFAIMSLMPGMVST